MDPADAAKGRFDVQTAHLERLTGEALGLVSTIESGEPFDAAVLAQTMGATLEYMLCDLFRQHDAAGAYWVDGVAIQLASLLPDRSVVATGYAWCCADRNQWQVPAQVLFALTDSPDSRLLFLKLRVGEAGMTLEQHRKRRTRAAPREWLLEFDVHLPVSVPHRIRL